MSAVTSNIKHALNKSLRPRGLRIVRVPGEGLTGVDFEHDLRVALPDPGAVCLDVGANKGQSIDLFLSKLDAPVIHSFEPSTRMLGVLQDRKEREGKAWNQVHLHSEALGDAPGQREFTNYENPLLSSLLELEDTPENPFHGDRARVRGRETVKVGTVDEFVREQGLQRVDLLKIDTQGFDLQVLRGAEESLRSGVIRYIFLEMNFVRMYEGQGGAVQLIDYLGGFDRFLIDMYDVYRPLGSQRMAWCSGLFGPA